MNTEILSWGAFFSLVLSDHVPLHPPPRGTTLWVAYRFLLNHSNESRWRPEALLIVSKLPHWTSSVVQKWERGWCGGRASSLTSICLGQEPARESILVCLQPWCSCMWDLSESVSPASASRFLNHWTMYLFVRFWPCWVLITLCGCGERGLLFVAVHGLLIVIASVVAEHGL